MKSHQRHSFYAVICSALLCFSCGVDRSPGSSEDPNLSESQASASIDSRADGHGSIDDMRIRDYAAKRSLSVVETRGQAASSIRLVAENEDGQFEPVQFVANEDDHVLPFDLYLVHDIEFGNYALVNYMNYRPANEAKIAPCYAGGLYFTENNKSVRIPENVSFELIGGYEGDQYWFLLNKENGYLFSVNDLFKSIHHQDITHEIFRLEMKQSRYDSHIIYFDSGIGWSRENDQSAGYLMKMRVDKTLEYQNFVSRKIADFSLNEDIFGNIRVRERFYDKDGNALMIDGDYYDYDLNNGLFRFGSDAHHLLYYVDGQLIPLTIDYGSLDGRISFDGKSWTYVGYDGESQYYLNDSYSGGYNHYAVIKVTHFDRYRYALSLIAVGQYLFDSLLVDPHVDEGYIHVYDCVHLKNSTYSFIDIIDPTANVISYDIQDSVLILDTFLGFNETYYYINLLTGEVSEEMIIIDQVVTVLYPVNADDYFYEVGWNNRTFFDMSGIIFEDMAIAYDGKAHDLEIQGELPPTVEVHYSPSNRLVEVGSITVTASFTSTLKYYEPIPDMVATLTIYEMVESSSDSTPTA